MPHGRPYTASEDQYIADRYGCMPFAQIAIGIGRTRDAVQQRAWRLCREGVLDVRTRYYHPQWSDADTQALREMVGDGLTRAQMARRLKRTPGAIEAHMHVLRLSWRKGSRYTLNRVATLMGVDSHAVTWWRDQGWLKVHRSKVRMGSYCMGFVEHDDLAVFVEDERYWHLWKPERITDSVWREWATELRGGIRFLTTAEAGELLCMTHQAVNKAIHEGRLRGVKHGPNWRIRADHLILLTRSRLPKRPVTGYEREYIRQHWDETSAAHIARALGRSDQTVAKQAARMGLRQKGRGWWRRNLMHRLALPGIEERRIH